MTDVHASLGSRRRKQRPHKALRSTALDPYCTDAVSPQVPLVRSSAEYQPSHIQPEESPRPTQPAPVPALTPTPETAVDVVRPDTKNQTEKYSSALVKEVPPAYTGLELKCWKSQRGCKFASKTGKSKAYWECNPKYTNCCYPKREHASAHCRHVVFTNTVRRVLF